MTTIGWIGLGKMGGTMARRLLSAGFPLWVWARNPEQALEFKRRGAQVATDLIELAQRSHIVITMLRDTSDVDEVYRAMRAGMQPNTLFIDMTTAAPAMAQRCLETATEVSAGFIDAPVTGSVADAAEGALTCFTGGGDSWLQTGLPVLRTLSSQIVHCGDIGSGYRMKLVNQTVLAGIFLGLADGLALARHDAFPPATVLEAIGSGPASGKLFQTYAERMLCGSDNQSFTLGQLRKDVRLARDEATRNKLPTDMLDLLLQRIDTASARFGPQAGVHMLSRTDL